MRTPRVYLETTIFNFYVDEDRGFAHANTVKLFDEIAAGNFTAYTSAVVVEELAKAPTKKYERMSSLIQQYNITILTLTDEADRLADEYVAEGVIPQKFRTDGLHIALASVNDLDMIISMNFRHIVKRKTILTTGKINNLNGYRSIEIYSPMEVVENEND
ncbi:MAG: hypothetical protein FWF73_04725 [Spirochaetes bacterium]|nr:hypothetical protein [Spirochaetota bacterium]